MDSASVFIFSETLVLSNFNNVGDYGTEVHYERPQCLDGSIGYLTKTYDILSKYLGKFGFQVGVGCKVCFIAVFKHYSLEKEA